MLRTTHAFATLALASASLGGALLALAMPSSWSAAAFAATAVPGLVFGTLLAHLHGRPGGAFAVVVGAGLFVRLALGCLVAILAACASPDGRGHRTRGPK